MCKGGGWGLLEEKCVGKEQAGDGHVQEGRVRKGEGCVQGRELRVCGKKRLGDSMQEGHVCKGRRADVQGRGLRSSAKRMCARNRLWVGWGYVQEGSMCAREKGVCSRKWAGDVL